MARQWISVRFSDNEIADFSQRAREELHRSTEAGSRLITDQRRRIVELERQQQKLMDAYLADAMTVGVLKARQVDVDSQLADAKRLLDGAQTAGHEVSNRLDQVLDLLRNAERLYLTVDDAARQMLNSAVFEAFKVDREDDGVRVVKATAPLTPLIEAVIARRQDHSGVANVRTPSGRKAAEGSNVTNLAVAEGFESSVTVPPSFGQKWPDLDFASL